MGRGGTSSAAPRRAVEAVAETEPPKPMGSTQRLAIYLAVPMAVLTMLALLMRAYRVGRDNIRCLHDEGALA